VRVKQGIKIKDVEIKIMAETIQSLEAKYKAKGMWSSNLPQSPPNLFLTRLFIENTQSYGIQAHENIVKAMTYYQACPPLSSNVKPALGGEQHCLKVEITPIERAQPKTPASLSFKAPEKYQSEGKNDLLHSASEVPEIIAAEQKIIGKPCSVATNSLSSQACSKP
jgi:hypothetical protein